MSSLITSTGGKIEVGFAGTRTSRLNTRPNPSNPHGKINSTYLYCSHAYEPGSKDTFLATYQ